jgi:hypothetical protein
MIASSARESPRRPRAQQGRIVRLVAAASLMLSVFAGSATAQPYGNVTVPVTPQTQTGNNTRLDHSQSTINSNGCFLVTMTMYVNSQLAAQSVRDADGNVIQYTPDQINNIAVRRSTNPVDVRVEGQVGSYHTDAFGNLYRPGETEPAYMPNPANPEGTIPNLPSYVPFNSKTATGMVNEGGILRRVTDDTRSRTPTGDGLVVKDSNPLNVPEGGADITQPANAALAQRIRDELNAGRPVPVWVNTDDGTPGHWVLIASWHDTGGFDIVDPWVDPITGERTGWLSAPPYNNTIFRSAGGNTFGLGTTSADNTLPSAWPIAPEDMGDPLLNPFASLPYVYRESRPIPLPSSVLVLAGLGVTLLLSRHRPHGT